MPTCSAFGYNNKQRRKKKPSLSFHRFPWRKPALLQKMAIKTQRKCISFSVLGTPPAPVLTSPGSRDSVTAFQRVQWDYTVDIFMCHSMFPLILYVSEQTHKLPKRSVEPL